MTGILFFLLAAATLLNTITESKRARRAAMQREKDLEEARERELAFFEELRGIADRLSALEECTETEELRKDVDELEKRFKTMENAILPDDSSARKAKEQIDAFNEGVYNILSYHGTPKKRAEVIDDEDDEADA